MAIGQGGSGYLKMISRTKLLIEAGRFAGGGSNASSPNSISGTIPNVATARFAGFPYDLDPKKEFQRRKREVERRDRLRELIREWISNRRNK